MTELQKINIKFSSDIKIATEQEKRFRNMLLLKSNIFLKENKIIDENIYSLFRIYIKKTKETYTVQVEYPAYMQSSSLFASCSCPDFVQRASKYSIACKHILKALQAIKNNTFIDLTNMKIKKVKPNIIKQNYLDIPCPKCSSKAVTYYKNLSCIFYENKDATYVCESCYHCF